MTESALYFSVIASNRRLSVCPLPQRMRIGLNRSAIVKKNTERNWKDKTKFSVAYREDLYDYAHYALNRRKWAHESENTFARSYSSNPRECQKNAQLFELSAVGVWEGN